MVFGFGKKSAPQADAMMEPEATTTHTTIGDEKQEIQADMEAKSSSSGNDVSKVNNLTEVEASREVQFLRKLHRWDPNLPEDTRLGLDRALADHSLEEEQAIINLMENDSPYAEVRAAVRNYDEDLPVNTIRAWVLGFLMVTLGSGLNMLFSLRNPSISISAFVAQLVAYPLGVGWDRIMPTRQFRTFGYTWSFNPGPFNMKEHALITIMANVSFGGGAAYSTDIIVALKGFYGYDLGWGWQMLVTFGSQMLGFGFAGLLRKYLVYPASMIWPTNFVNTSLFYALHDHSVTDPASANGWKISRYRWFFYVFLGSFVWYWFPGELIYNIRKFVRVTTDIEQAGSSKHSRISHSPLGLLRTMSL